MLRTHIFHDALDDLWLSLSRLTLRLVLLQQAIEPILNLDLRASLYLEAYLVPLATQFLPELQDVIFLFNSPFVAPHVRIDHIDPALSTLPWFALAAWADSFVEFFGDACPLLRLGQCCRTGFSACGLYRLSCDFLSNAFEYLSFPSSPGRLFPFNVLYKKPALLTL